MTENQLFTLAIVTLQAGFAARGITGIKVRQGYQPRITGTPTAPFLCLHNIGIHRYGWTGKKDVLVASPPFVGTLSGGDVEVISPLTPPLKHQEKQYYEWAFQCDAQVPVAPAPGPLPDLVASDYVRMAASIFASDAGLVQLRAGGCGLERITEIRTPFYKDDSDQFQASPSFDVTLTFLQVDESTTPVLNRTKAAGRLPV